MLGLGTFAFLGFFVAVAIIRFSVEVKAAKNGKRYTNIRH